MKVLIIEDHSAMVEGYKRILERVGEKIDYFVAPNCEQAISKVAKIFFDLILLDINIPSHETCESGYELAFLIKKQQPSAKLLVLTSYIDKITLYSIFKDINPEGILVKSDFSPVQLIDSVKRILKRDEQIFSDTVIDSVEEIKREGYLMDALNRKLIVLISMGYKTKTLSEKMGISISSVDKRKALIKEYMRISKGTDEDIVTEARRLGLL